MRNSEIYSKALNKGELNKFINELMGDLFKGIPAGGNGKIRSMFASAMTPNGLCNYLDTIMTVEKVYEIRGALGTGEDKILEKIKDAAIDRGFYVEAYYCALNPYKLDHLVIPDMNLAFTTTNSYHSSTVEKIDVIDMLSYMDDTTLMHYKGDLDQNLTDFEHLLNTALQTIKRAKALHDELETYYVPNINFDGIDKLYNKVLDRILEA